MSLRPTESRQNSFLAAVLERFGAFMAVINQGGEGQDAALLAARTFSELASLLRVLQADSNTLDQLGRPCKLLEFL